GSQADTFVFGNGVAVGGTVTGGPGADTLDDSASTANLTWAVTGGNAGAVNGVAFAAVENLTGGGGNDAFVFANGAGVAGTVAGGAGANALDYSAAATGVAVNLTVGTATGTGGVAAIQHVFGGAG